MTREIHVHYINPSVVCLNNWNIEILQEHREVLFQIGDSDISFGGLA